MKLTHYLRTAMAMVLIASTVFGADAAVKKNKARKTTNTGIVLTKGATHTYADGALTTQDFTYKRGKYSIKVEYPTGGNDALVTEVRKWIQQRLVEGFTGSLATPDELIKKLVANNKKDGASEYDLSITVPYSNPKIITVNLKDFAYWGGAHGGSADVSGTFSVDDAQLLTAEMLPAINKMRPYILQGLANNSIDREWLDDPASIDYGVPYIMGDELHIIYGEYAIGPYCIGMPEAIIPLAEIKGLLSQQVINKYF